MPVLRTAFLHCNAVSIREITRPMYRGGMHRSFDRFLIFISEPQQKEISHSTLRSRSMDRSLESVQSYPIFVLRAGEPQSR